jgi:hypothetical protein
VGLLARGGSSPLVRIGSDYDSAPTPLGALAKLAKAPASKVGDSRFESWVPRYFLGLAPFFFAFFCFFFGIGFGSAP